MNQLDKISREVLNLLNYSKDVTSNNLSKANSTGKLEPKLTDEQLSFVVNLVESSLTQGYQKAIGSFQKSVNGVLTEKNIVDTKKKK